MPATLHISDGGPPPCTDADLPSVSVLIPTYNFADYIDRSVSSALDQDYPAEKLEVVVVDDGSQDHTSRIVAAYGDRVRYIRKDNGGVISSLNRLIAECRGDLLCIQSGDDISFPDRVRQQAGAFFGRPELGLHYCDMAIIDHADRLLHPSWFRSLPLSPERGRHPPAGIVHNLAAGGSMMLSRAFLDAFYPIPDWAGVEDWWISLRVAEVAEIDYTEQALYGYRRHGTNLSLGAKPGEERLVRHERSLLPLRRWIATNAHSPQAGIEHWSRVWADLQAMARLVAGAGHDLRDILVVDEHDRATAMASQKRALILWAQGRRSEAVRAAVAAYGHDPFDGEITTTSRQLISLASVVPAADRPFEAREFVTLTTGARVLESPHLLSAYGSTFGDADPVSLGIIVRESDVTALIELVDALDLGGETGPDLVALPTTQLERAVLAAYLPHADAVLSEGDGRLARGARLVAETFGMEDLGALFRASAHTSCRAQPDVVA